MGTGVIVGGQSGPIPRVGLVTIGQTPRPDLQRAFVAHAPHVTFDLIGALDGLDPAQLADLTDDRGDYPLLVRLAGGGTTTVERSTLVPLVDAASHALVDRGARLIVVLCAGAFPSLTCAAPVLYPGRIAPAVAGAWCRSGRVGIVTPIAAQVSAARAKWTADGFDPVVTFASPVAHDEMAAAAHLLASASVELVVLDCFGHDDEYRDAFSDLCGRPVIAVQSVVARLVGALSASTSVTP
ncbi:MAG: AroM family protein [Vicinamibacterales bacterium]